MINIKKPKVTIGIISYKDKKYLEQGLPTLLNQDYENYEIMVCDNTPEEEILPWLKKEFPTIIPTSNGGNIGFGPAHNHMIQMAVKNGSDYYLCFNSDMFASKTYVSELVKYMQEFAEKYPNKKLGCLTPKLLQWKNFPESPLNIQDNTYDTTGVMAFKSHKFAERGFGDIDSGQFDDQTEIWGASGASPIFPIKVLQDIQHSEGEFFDNGFFMYKEDIDLSYRLRWAGYEIQYTSKSVAWHDRTGDDPGGIINQINKRRDRAVYIKENSFLNHLQMVYKNWSTEYSWRMKIKTAFFLFKYVAYLALFDRNILKKYSDFKKLKPSLKLKREKMIRRILAREMEQLFT